MHVTRAKMIPQLIAWSQSISEFGFKIPVLARTEGEVVDGHLRLKAAAKLGLTELERLICDEQAGYGVHRSALQRRLRRIHEGQADDSRLSHVGRRIPAVSRVRLCELRPHCAAWGFVYVCHALSVQREFQTAIEAAGFTLQTCLAVRAQR